MRSLLERQRITNEAVGTLDAIAVAAEGTDANAQVFQVRDGVLADRQSFYLENEAGRDEGEVLEEFVLQYYASALSIPPQVIVRRGHRAHRACWRRRWPSAAAAPVEVRPAERGDKRRILELAERNARLALDQDRLRSERTPHAAGSRRSTGSSARSGWSRSRCGSSASTSRTSARPTRSPRWWSSRAARRRSPTTAASRSAEAVQDDFAAMAEVLVAGGCRSTRAQRELLTAREGLRRELRRAAGADRDRRRQGPALRRAGGAGASSASSGTTVISLAKQLEEVFVPGRPAPLLLPHDSAPLQLLQRVRDEAHRFAIEFHRGRRDRAMTRSVLDDLPGVGPARKRAILGHFGTPERFLAASREELEAVPGLPGKTAREIIRVHAGRLVQCAVVL